MNGDDIEEFAAATQDLDINYQLDLGWTLLHWAANDNRLGIAQFLLDHEANTNILDDESVAPLAYAGEQDSPMYQLLSLHNYQEPTYEESTLIAGMHTTDLSMQILGGFMFVVGCAAVATAFVLLNSITCGLVATLGVGSILAGIGLFSNTAYNNRTTLHREVSTVEFAETPTISYQT